MEISDFTRGELYFFPLHLVAGFDFASVPFAKPNLQRRFALASDLFPKQAIASVVGLGGMAGALAAMAFSESTGFILEATGSYWSLFAIASTAYLAALAVIHWLSPQLKPVGQLS